MYGIFYTGLTKDDVSGLGYLLSTNNFNYENLLPDVRGTGRHRKHLVQAHGVRELIRLRLSASRKTWERGDF